jgi:hypothetical protein
VPLQYDITAPTPGQKLRGNVPVLGTALFDPAQVAYFKLEIGSGPVPTEWTTFGATHNQAVRAGLLETLPADALPPGEYTIRLALVGHDGNFVAPPFSVPVTVGQ